jgi:hypothetical protein
MRLRSAWEDLKSNTLARIHGRIAKLVFFGERRRGGAYVHWGLERAHGRDAAERALLHGHRAALAEVLKTPVRELVADITQGDALHGPIARDVADLRKAEETLIPPETPTRFRLHLRSILEALARLPSTQAPARPGSESLPQSPDRQLLHPEGDDTSESPRSKSDENAR